MDWQTATDDARRMEAINPNSATVLHEMFRYYQVLGFPYRALAAARGVVKLNPLSFVDPLQLSPQHSFTTGNGRKRYRPHTTRSCWSPISLEALAMLRTADAHSGRLKDAHAIFSQLLTSNT